MLYKIKIDKSTIQKNKDAGRNQFCIPGKKTETKIILICADTLCKLYPDSIKVTGSGHTIKKVTFIENFITEIKNPSPEEQQSKGWKKVYNREVEEYILIHTIERPVQSVRLLQSIPNYSAKYEQQTIECKYCKEKFEYTDLESEDYDEYSVINICPKCHKKECSEIEYEEFDNKTGEVKNKE